MIEEVHRQYYEHIEADGVPLAFATPTPDREGEEEWPVPRPLQSDLPAVDAFSLELLPESFRPLVEDVSDRMQTPPDFAGVVTVVALAGCVNRRAVITPKRHDSSWEVVPNLWGGIVARPGFMKSPVLQAMIAPLDKIEKGWREQYERENAEHEAAKELVELEHQAWREQTKQAIKKGQNLPPAPTDVIATPTRRRLLATDATYEKLHELHAENPAGLFVIRDELPGWLAGLDRTGREGERGFYLQGWNGDGAFDVDRIGRGTIHVPHVCISLFGNIQPARLRSYLSDALLGGPGDDGLFQRFQLLVWPDTNKAWTLVDRPPNLAALALAAKVFSVLAELPVERPLRLRFDDAAQALFFDWWTALELELRSEHGLHPAMVAHLSKYRSLMPTLAALFELADRVASGQELKDGIEVNLDHARQAAAFCDYLESHARRVYSCAASPDVEAAKGLLRHIEAGDLPASMFTSREVYRKSWKGLDHPEAVRAALELLEDSGWVREIKLPDLPGRGRPSPTWEVNPKVVRDEAE